jgi:hypothetical protein
MEDNPVIIQSPFFDERLYKEQIERISNAATKAQEIIDYTTAHDEDILRAIDIVEQFLRKKHRLCYGGQAINAHLPKRYKIYDPEYSIPDYDFFTPAQEEDIRVLTKDLRKAGFTEISAREGMHKGTKKIYVNFIPVADMTAIDSKLYKLLSEREFRQDGISYLDANTLRMLMYLELSRPRGEVSRWEKVYERLLLLNEFVPVHLEGCKKKSKKDILHEDEVRAIMDYTIREKRIFAGADLLGMYKGALAGKRKANWLLRTRRPIYIFTNDLEKDSDHFRYELKHLTPEESLRIHKIQAMGGDLIPTMTVFTRNDYPILILVSQNACHSYYNIPLKYGNNLRVATLDTLITLYFSLALLKYKFVDIDALECLAQELVEISYRARQKPDEFPFPFISLDCSGHQKRISSLIREKVQRITQERKNRLENSIAGKNSRLRRTVRNRNILREFL